MDISSMLEVQVNEVKVGHVKENVTPKEFLSCSMNLPQDISNDEKHYYKQMFPTGISGVRFGRIHCTACDTHIGSAPSEAFNMFRHPVLRTLLCKSCHEFYGDGTFEQGDDATDMFCRWCANGGNLYCCSYCSNTFCAKCVKRNLNPAWKKRIEADEKWKCFVCNPSPLYGLRAICWALLEHVQHVTRILQVDKTITQNELDHRMDLDDTTCCPRRRKRKRRRTASNSEDEDQTYTPECDTKPFQLKRKLGKKPIGPSKSNSVPAGNTITVTNIFATPSTVNGTVNLSSIPFSNVPRIKLPPKPILERNNAPSSNVFHKHLLNGGKTITVREYSSLASVNSTNFLPVTVNSDVVQQHNVGVLNAVATASLLQPSSSSSPTHVATQSLAIPTVQTVRSQATPMVTIPKQSTGSLPRIYVANPLKLNSQASAALVASAASIASVASVAPTSTPAITTTPSVIDLDSDSDEASALQPGSMSITHVPSKSVTRTIAAASDTGTAVPVALVSSRGTFVKGVETEQYLREKRSTLPRNIRNFNQRLIPCAKEIDFILSNLKSRLHELFENTKRDEWKKVDVNDARVTTKRFHREIRVAVTQLAHINDRVVREYNRWKRIQIKRGLGGTFRENNTTVTKEANVDIPLDMTCTNESDGETDDCDEVESNVISPCDLIATSNVLENLLFFKKKKTVDRAVGSSQLSLPKTKAVEVQTEELQETVNDAMDDEDYDSPSELIKSDIQEETSVLNPVNETNKTRPTRKLKKKSVTFVDEYRRFLRVFKRRQELIPSEEDPIHDNLPVMAENDTVDDDDKASKHNDSTSTVKKDASDVEEEPTSSNVGSISLKKSGINTSILIKVNADLKMSQPSVQEISFSQNELLSRQVKILEGNESTDVKDSSATQVSGSTESETIPTGIEICIEGEEEDCTIIDE